MTTEHPIAPPPELVLGWTVALDCPDMPSQKAIYIATQAARWGDEQRLEACCEWVADHISTLEAAELRVAMRPKPPSLAEKALDDLDTIQTHDRGGYQVADLSTIRRALERLQELENNG